MPYFGKKQDIFNHSCTLWGFFKIIQKNLGIFSTLCVSVTCKLYCKLQCVIKYWICQRDDNVTKVKSDFMFTVNISTQLFRAVTMGKNTPNIWLTLAFRICLAQRQITVLGSAYHGIVFLFFSFLYFLKTKPFFIPCLFPLHLS